MNVAILCDVAISPALSLLPAKMHHNKAVMFLVAVAVQETGLRHRKQVKGSARGWWQFESRGGVWDVHNKGSVREHGARVRELLGYRGLGEIEVHKVLEHNDVLAAAYARLLLWTLPHALPATEEEGWRQYLLAWRPGKPSLRRWRQAWALGQTAHKTAPWVDVGAGAHDA